MMYEEKTNPPIRRPNSRQVLADRINMIRIRKAMMNGIFVNRCVVAGRIIANDNDIIELPNNEMRWRENVTLSSVYECFKMKAL